ncbi:protein prenyltransferase alpha subunit repeat-containing protein 1 isoform X6 [Syngnathus scovelli]|uniref:protein prenyltransferase alpha subunit repeat-containing protein 1 isoform X6 n=1 Tax=Syngnathus scovelli TaxID=161590 RepID=UPI0035CC975D
MAESRSELDVLVQRVVKDISNALKRNPNIDEIGVIPCPEGRYNRSPIVVLENKLGVESWCLKFLLPYVHSKLLLYRQQKHWLDKEALVDITSTLLLLNPDFTTAWNVRRWVLQQILRGPSDVDCDGKKQQATTMHGPTASGFCNTWPKAMSRRHVFYLWHQWRWEHQLIYFNSNGGTVLHNIGDAAQLKPGAQGCGDRGAGAIEVDGIFLPDPCNKRLKRGGYESNLPSLSSECTFLSAILDRQCNPEQRHFGLAYKKWLDSVINKAL